MVVPRALTPAWIRVVFGIVVAAASFAGTCSPSIGFESTRTGSLATDGAMAEFRFVSPALGSNTSIVASFRVEDAKVADGVVPPNGSYALEILLDGAPVASAAPSAPGAATLLTDFTFQPGLAYDIRVTEVEGSVPRSFNLTMSPRYSLPATDVGFGDVRQLSVDVGETETLALRVAAGQTGETDLFLQENTQVRQTTNVVKVLDVDHVTVKATASNANSVSLDNSLLPDLGLRNPGTYLILVSHNAAVPVAHQLFVGPFPGGGTGETSACEVVPAPPFGVEVTVGGRLAPVGDRDCFSLTLAQGASALDFRLDETSSNSPGQNEVRIQQIGGDLTAKKGDTDFRGSVPVDTSPGSGPPSFQVVVNNLAEGAPNYALTLKPTGSCVGASCVLAPTTSVSVDFAAEGATVAVRRIAFQDGSPIPLPDVASFELDHTSGGTFRLDIVRQLGDGSQVPLCSVEDNADAFIENCVLSAGPGQLVAIVRRTAGSGTDVNLVMGPLLLGQAQGLPSGGPLTMSLVADGSLDTFGAEAYFPFTLGQTAQVGLGFDDDVISKGLNRVCIAPRDNLGFLFTTPPVCALQCTGDNDCQTEATPLPAGDYVLVVDNDGAGTGGFRVCAGPGVDASDKDGMLITVPPPSVPDGKLSCGDTDTWTVQLGGAGPISTTFHVEELDEDNDGDNVGALAVRLVWGGVTLASDQGAGSAEVSFALQSSTTYGLVIDNTSTGAPRYRITVSTTSGTGG